jgi:competence protein ComEC
MLVCAALAVVAARKPLVVAAFAAVAFFAGGASLSIAVWQRAWAPPLFDVFQRAAIEERVRLEKDGRRHPLDDEATIAVEGVLRADASMGAAGVALPVDVDTVLERRGDGEIARRKAAGGVQVTVVGDLARGRIGSWRAGRRVRFPAQLHRPARYLDDGVPDGERALARRGVRLVGSVKSGALVEVVVFGSAWSEALASTRAFARTAIADAVGRWSAQSSAIVSAIVIGDRTALDQDVQRALQEAGTFHVIAISGGNIAILAGVLLTGFRIGGRLGPPAMAVAMAALAWYAQLVGGGASVDRATMMAELYFGARLVDQRTPSLNALATVAALLTVLDPLSIADPAFLLTCGATLAILLVMRAVDLRSSSRAAGAIRAMVLTSIAVEILLFPIGAWFFSRITVAGIALNLAAIPLMGVAQVAGMVVVPLALVSRTAAAGAGALAHAAAFGLVASARLVEYAPLLTWRVAPPSAVVVVIYYMAMGIAWTLWRRRLIQTVSAEGEWTRRARRSALAAAGVAAIWIAVDPASLAASRGDGRLHVTFLDVGQGDAIFVVFPHGSTLLVDAGGLGFASAFDIGDRVVAPAIRHAGFRRLDRLVISHGDPDHAGGALAIVRDFHPKEIWEGIPVPRSVPLTTLREAAQMQGADWKNVAAGYGVTEDDVHVEVRHPAPPDWERQRVRNDDSLVLEVRWGDVSIWLTGDIGREVEQTLTSAGPPAPLTVVKIPHHGSLSSSSMPFVEALRPQIAVASVGRSNHFGHPVPEVVGRYESVGAEVFRTDRDGAVSIETDGRTLVARTFTGAFIQLPRKHEIAK